MSKEELDKYLKEQKLLTEIPLNIPNNPTHLIINTLHYEKYFAANCWIKTDSMEKEDAEAVRVEIARDSSQPIIVVIFLREAALGGIALGGLMKLID